MNQKKFKNWKTLAGEWKEQRKTKLTPEQIDDLNTSLEWAAAIEVCEKTGTAFSDSMILNALKSSNLLFVVTLDFDIGCATLSDPNMKDVIAPDRLFKEYRHYHFS